MIRSNWSIFSENSSRVGKAISDSWLIGVPSCFSGRPQDGEVDEVDRGIRLQEVAPGALAGMRLAGDEEDAQILADAVDAGDGAVVDRGQFAGERLGVEFDDVLAAMGDVER